jgi:antirestriction protein ArdC
MWLTFRQALALKGAVKKGEKACPVVFWKRLAVEDEKTGDKTVIPLLRFYHVFNLSQCDGIDRESVEETPQHNLGGEPANIVTNMPDKPVIKDGFTKAYYVPAEDCVAMPKADRFKSSEDYFATLFHELVHSTGHEKRLNRAAVAERTDFNSEPYGKEELTAEMGAAFLCGHAGIGERTIDNSAAYLKGWLKQLKADSSLVVQAAAQAQRAADFILSRTYEESEDANGNG